MQAGQLKQIGPSWFVRYYESGKRITKKLGTVEEFPKERDIVSVFQAFMSDINSTDGTFTPSVGMLLRTFVNDKYFPDAKKELRGSTLRGYKTIWNKHVEPKLGHLRIRDVRTFDCQQAIDTIVQENSALKKASLFRIKNFMSVVFSEAIRAGLRKDDKNPVASNKRGDGGVKIRGRKNERKGETFAHSLKDIKTILNALTGSSKVLMAVAAYTGLRRGEIVGLKWEDYDGKALWVRRNVCFGERGEMSVELPKTEASEAPVPVIAPLREILDAWKNKAELTEGCWMFQAGFTRKKDHPESLLDAAKLTPLSPTNNLRDVIIPAFEKNEIEWHGYHAFRRGLATNLRALGVDDLTIKDILRHSDVSVTRAAYIKRVPEKSQDAMDRFESSVQSELRKPAQPVKSGMRSGG